jgi:hypothetical protein
LRIRIPATTQLGQAHFIRGEYERVVALATGNLAVPPIGSTRIWECSLRHRSSIASG